MGANSSVTNSSNVVNNNISTDMLSILNQNTNNLVANTVVNSASTCSAGIAQVQNVTIEDNTAEGDINIAGVNQNQSSAITFNCLVESTTDSSINSELINKMMASLTNTFSAKALEEIAQEAAAKASGQFAGGSSSANANNYSNATNNNTNYVNQELKNILTNNITNNLSTSSVNNCISTVSASQNFNVLKNKSSGSINIGVISQNQASNSMVECVQKANVANNLTNKILSELGIHVVSEQEFFDSQKNNQGGSASAETEGLLTQIGKAISSIISSVGGLLASLELGPVASIIGCIVIVLIILFIIFKSHRSSSNKHKSDNYVPQSNYQPTNNSTNSIGFSDNDIGNDNGNFDSGIENTIGPNTIDGPTTDDFDMQN